VIYMNYLVPNTALGKGKIRIRTVQTLSAKAMTASEATQDAVDIPSQGDILGFEFVLTQSTEGTLTGAKTIANAIKNLSIKDVRGQAIWSKIRGIDLSLFSRYMNIGRNRTIATSANSANTHRWFVPCNIEMKHMTARLETTIAPYSDMATSGATGGSFTLEVKAWYMDETQIDFTQRFSRRTLDIISGSKSFAAILPKSKFVQNMLFTIGTESNISSINFSENGDTELSDLKLAGLITLDDERLVDGHVTGEFSLYNSSFTPTDLTQFDVEGAGSDSMQLFLVVAE